MTALINWLSGRKTYIVAGASLVYAVLALTGVAPNPDKLGVWAVQISLLAAAFRSALGKLEVK